LKQVGSHMIFKCQSCGETFPLIQAELEYGLVIENLYCRKCYANSEITDSLVNVMAFADIAD
jgi:hypothetical protein